MGRFVEQPDGRLLIYASRWKTAFLVLGSFAFVAIGIWIATAEYFSDIPVWQLILVSYIGIPFFGVIGIFAAHRYFSRDAVLEIDTTGITDRSSLVSCGMLRWDEIEFVIPYTYSGQPMLGIVPSDLDGFLARQSALKRLLFGMALKLGSAPINIPQVILPMKVHELAELIQTRYGVRIGSDA